MIITSAKSRARFLRAMTLIAAGCLITGCAGGLMPGDLPGAAEDASAAKPVAADAGTVKSADQAAGPAGPIPTSATKAALAESRKLKAKGQIKEALAGLDKASQARPTENALLVEQGLLYLELGQPQKAQRLLSQTLPASAKDWRVLSGLGVAYASLGQQKEAQRYFKKAIAISPENPTVLNNLAMSYLIDRKPQQAETTLRQATATGTAPAEATRNLSLAVALNATAEDGATTR